jgi:hypothetical protein
MSGFYFQGEAFKPAWNLDRCYADLENGQRVPLDIKDLGSGRYDIILAGSKRFSGRAYYNFNYAGDFSKAGLIGRTTSPEHGELVYFDWAPVEWDEDLEYRALRLVLPVAVGAEALSDEEKAAVPMLTEPGVNEENRIDYYGSLGADGRHYLSILFYQENPRAYASQLLELYFPADFLPLSAELGERASGSPDDAGAGVDESEGSYTDYYPSRESDLKTRPLLAALAIGLSIAASLALYYRRAKAHAQKAALVKGIAWAGDSWSPPKLFAGSYQVPGKVIEDLNPVELALLMELPLPRVAAIMIEGLSAQGLVALDREDPLKLRFLGAASAQTPYEERFLAAFDAEGEVLPGLMADFFEDSIKALQEKLWDCDLEATRAYYRKKLAEEAQAEAEQASWPEERRRQYRSSHAHWYYWHGYNAMLAHPQRYSALSPCRKVCPRATLSSCAPPPVTRAVLRRPTRARWMPAIPPATMPVMTPVIAPATALATPPATAPATRPACPGAAIEALRIRRRSACAGRDRRRPCGRGVYTELDIRFLGPARALRLRTA